MSSVEQDRRIKVQSMAEGMAGELTEVFLTGGITTEQYNELMSPFATRILQAFRIHEDWKLISKIPFVGVALANKYTDRYWSEVCEEQLEGLDKANSELSRIHWKDY